LFNIENLLTSKCFTQKNARYFRAVDAFVEACKDGIFYIVFIQTKIGSFRNSQKAIE